MNSPIDKLLSRDGVREYWIAPDAIGRSMNGRHKIYSCVDVSPQNPGWTEVIDAAHVAKLEAALKVAVEAIKKQHKTWAHQSGECSPECIYTCGSLSEIERIAGEK